MSSLDEFLLCLTFFCFARMEGWILFFWGETHTVGIHIFNGLMKTGPSGHSIAEEPLLDSRLAETLRGIDRVAPKDIDHVIGVIELHAEELRKGKNTGNFTLTKIKGRDWLLTPEGRPFFAHGITHAGNQFAKLDFQRFSKACRELGFNAYGYGCPQQLRDDMPYVASWNHLVPISYYRGKNGVKFVDVFDAKVEAQMESGVKAYCRINANTSYNVIGYCWTDLGSWPLKNPSGKNWVDFIRKLPKDAAGQKAYQAFLQTWKGDDGKERDQAFLRLIAQRYFRILGEAQRKHAPKQLIFGDRFGFNTLDPNVMKEMLPYVDAIAIQPPFHGQFPKEKFDEIHQLTQKPILICDFAIRFKDGEKDILSWKPAADSVAAGKAYAEYVQAIPIKTSK